MGRTVGIGLQDFEDVRRKEVFYIDKTEFIREWWEAKDDVTLIARPRRFGKTLNMSMLEKFFSADYAGRGDLFEGLAIWDSREYRELQGTYPVISLSFADAKAGTFLQMRKTICRIIKSLYSRYSFLLESGLMKESEKEDFRKISVEMEDNEAAFSLKALSGYLCRYYGKKVIVLLDEYDTPMQEAYVKGYWDELVEFIRGIFNSTFKTNPYLERAVMTGITRVSKESIFSDLNNLKVVTTTSGEYAAAFGFTQEEVFAALDRYGMPSKREEVKRWYDGFTFGNVSDIYNPWSIVNYIDTGGECRTYWANTRSNSLVGKLIREGTSEVKRTFEQLFRGEAIRMEIDEQIVYNQLSVKKNALWSLLLASGYLKVAGTEYVERTGKKHYELALTNKEVWIMFRDMVCDWFQESGYYNDFIRALLANDLEAMNAYMARVTNEIFSYFDTGSGAFGEEPEKFYHGFVLGLMAELGDRYNITSNRESGFGRYDVMLEPQREADDGIIIEFKVQSPKREKELLDTVAAALKQIEDRNYAAALAARGIPEHRIRKYGFAFCGKKVLIGEAG